MLLFVIFLCLGIYKIKDLSYDIHGKCIVSTLAEVVRSDDFPPVLTEGCAATVSLTVFREVFLQTLYVVPHLFAPEIHTFKLEDLLVPSLGWVSKQNKKILIGRVVES